MEEMADDMVVQGQELAVHRRHRSELTTQIKMLIERECAAAGGLEAAANTWIKTALRLQKGEGRGKLNRGATGATPSP